MGIFSYVKELIKGDPFSKKILKHTHGSLGSAYNNPKMALELDHLPDDLREDVQGMIRYTKLEFKETRYILKHIERVEELLEKDELDESEMKDLDANLLHIISVKIKLNKHHNEFVEHITSMREKVRGGLAILSGALSRRGFKFKW